jgi:hypothetical protein
MRSGFMQERDEADDEKSQGWRQAEFIVRCRGGVSLGFRCGQLATVVLRLFGGPPEQKLPSMRYMSEIRTYDGYFTFKILSREKADQLDDLFAEGGVEVDLALQSLEFSWMGVERENVIQKLFMEVARTIGDAEGELRCEIDDDAVDPHFEFFTIKGGQLLMQRAKVVREEELIPQT